MLKIYHIYPLLLVFILLLSSCAVDRTVEQKGVIRIEDKFKLEQLQTKVLYVQALQQLSETQPEAYQIFQQARIAEANGELETAIEGYHQAIQKAPENGFLLTALGIAYIRKEDTIPARRYLRKAVRSNPNDYKSRLGLGYIYLHSQQFKAAAEQLEASLRLLTTLEGTFLLGEVEDALGNLKRAKQLFQTVAQADKGGQLGKAAATHLRSLEK